MQAWFFPLSTAKQTRLGLLLPLVRPLGKMILASTVLAFLLNAVGCLLPFAGKIAIDFLVVRTGFDRLESWLQSIGLTHYAPAIITFFSTPTAVFPLLAGVGLIAIFLAFLHQLTVFRLQQEFAFSLKSTLFDRVLRFPLRFFSRHSGGYLTARINNDVETCSFLFSCGLSQTISHGFRVFWGTLLLFSLNRFLCLIFLATTPVYAALHWFFARLIRRAGWREREQAAQVEETIQESFAGVETVKAFGGEPRQRDRMSDRLRQALGARERETTLGLLSRSLSRVFQGGTALILLGMGLQQVMEDRMTVGDLVTFAAGCGIVTLSLGEIAGFYVDLQPLFTSLFRIMSLLRRPIEDDLEKQESLFERSPAANFAEQGAVPTRGDLSFEKVDFAYTPGKPVLREFCGVARAGEITAIAAPSGAGKTTLVKLLLRFFAPQSGEIRFSHQAISTLPLREYRRRIGYVAQDVFLFQATVFDNLRVACPDATVADVTRVCQQALIHQDIMHLPRGYDTLLGERGATLSLGQRQRLALARALLRAPVIFLLDEPTSALDAATEEALLNGLRETLKSSTTILISHKTTIHSFADRVLAFPLEPRG
jgi:subfamily B ATP-binding cassette protein MsbA